MPDEQPDLDRVRAEFFRRTRRSVVFLYAGLALAALVCLAPAIADDAAVALLAFAVTAAATTGLFLASARIPTSAKAARRLLWVAPAVAVLTVSFVDIDLGERGTAIVPAAVAGLFLGTIAGIAGIRRRLARDDDLFRRQQRLGFDPEHPWAWIRKG